MGKREVKGKGNNEHEARKIGWRCGGDQSVVMWSYRFGVVGGCVVVCDYP